MRGLVKAIVLLFVFLFVGCTARQGGQSQSFLADGDSSSAPPPMAVVSSGIVEGVIGDPFGVRGVQNSDGIPTCSIPLSIENIPDDAVCFALVLFDSDAKQGSGEAGIHWMAVFTVTSLPENASLEMESELLQGQNTFGKEGYGGPNPSDKAHTYTLTVYALSEMPSLAGGYTYAQLTQTTANIVVAQAQISGTYAP